MSIRTLTQADLEWAARTPARWPIESEAVRWYQPLWQDGDDWVCIRSTEDGSERCVLPAQRATPMMIVALPVPLPMIPFGELIDGDIWGHNSIAAFVSLAAEAEADVVFRYQKPKSTEPEERHLRVTWADGPRFGGLDHDRGDQQRSFRLDRVKTIAIGERSVQVPQFVIGHCYKWGLR